MGEPVGAKRILLIDDEEIVRRCGERTLRPEGYEVDISDSGAQGLSMLRERGYDLVITDLKMPRMDGVQLMQSIRQIRPEARVVIITGYITDGTRDAVLAAGALDCLEKPFTPEDLITLVKNTIGWSGE